MTSGEALPDQVKAVISDSPYTSVYDMCAYQMSRMYRLPAFRVLDSTSYVTRMKEGYSLRKASALEQVEKAELPMLYIHGNEDTFVTTRISKELYEHTKNKEEAELMIVDGAGHGEAFVIDRDKYVKKLTIFLQKHTTSRSGIYHPSGRCVIWLHVIDCHEQEGIEHKRVLYLL